MLNKTLSVIFIFSFFLNSSYAINHEQLVEQGDEAILHFIEFDEHDDYVRLKKESVLLLQELLDNNKDKEEGFFSGGTVLKIMGAGAVVLNFILAFKLFDTMQKSSEDIEGLKEKERELQEDMRLCREQVKGLENSFIGIDKSLERHLEISLDLRRKLVDGKKTLAEMQKKFTSQSSRLKKNIENSSKKSLDGRISILEELRVIRRECQTMLSILESLQQINVDEK